MDENVERRRGDDKKNEVTIGVTANGFPLALWRKWEKDCKEKYNDCRWIKMWTDHVRSVSMDQIDRIQAEMDSIKEMIKSSSEKEIEDDKDVKTIGGEKDESE